MPKIADLIRRRRLALNMTREHLAVAAGRGYATIARIEQTGNMSQTTANKLAEVLKLDPVDLRPTRAK